jgi:hypothetical protein
MSSLGPDRGGWHPSAEAGDALGGGRGYAHRSALAAVVGTIRNASVSLKEAAR